MVPAMRKHGAWYSYKGEKMAQGKENVKLLFKSNSDMRDEIEALVREHYGISKKKKTDE